MSDDVLTRQREGREGDRGKVRINTAFLYSFINDSTAAEEHFSAFPNSGTKRGVSSRWSSETELDISPASRIINHTPAACVPDSAQDRNRSLSRSTVAPCQPDHTPPSLPSPALQLGRGPTRMGGRQGTRACQSRALSHAPRAPALRLADGRESGLAGGETAAVPAPGSY